MGLTLAQRLERIERLTAMAATNVWGVADVALLLNVREDYIYSLTSQKKIPHYKQGKKVWFKREEIEAWQLENRVATDDEITSDAMTYTATHKRNK